MNTFVHESKFLSHSQISLEAIRKDVNIGTITVDSDRSNISSARPTDSCDLVNVQRIL